MTGFMLLDQATTDGDSNSTCDVFATRHSTAGPHENRRHGRPRLQVRPSNFARWPKPASTCSGLNMAHAEPDVQQVHVDNIRRLSDELGEPIAILVDLAGPEDSAGRVAGRPHLLRVGRRVRRSSPGSGQQARGTS